MNRQGVTILWLLAASLITLTSAACSSGSEQALLTQFFSASRIRDTTALDSFSLAVFEPRAEGTVTSFEIVNVTPEDHKPLALKTLTQAHDEAKAADEAFAKRKEAYETQNMDVIQRVVKAERESAKLKGKDAEVQATWVKMRDERTQNLRRIADARAKLTSESRIVALSVSDPRAQLEVKKREGELVSKDVTVSAPVTMPDGQKVQKTLIVTIQRAILQGDKPITGKWVITAVKDTTGSPANKTS
jgi:hypothetical protein